MAVVHADIAAAAARIEGQVKRTPTLRSGTLSKIAGCELWIKFENLQFIASFKERGALNKLLQLSSDERARGVIAMSAGNHAQAVAYHAGRLDIAATIVMPKFTPNAKVAATRHHGARVILEGETLAEAASFARDMAAKEKLVFVHPYDDAAIVAGQGTLALEMLADQPDLDALVVPIGGGGMIAGCTIAAKAINPKIDIYGVEVSAFASAAQRKAGKQVQTGGTTIAEGIAVADIGAECWPAIERDVREVLVVDELEVERAIVLLIEIEKTVAEGAGAAGLAAILAHRDRFAGRRVGMVLCGGNIDTRVLSSVLLRGLARDGRLLRLEVDIADRPGALAEVARRIGESGGNIVEIEHQRIFTEKSAKNVVIETTVEVIERKHGENLIAALNGAGFPTRPV
ncbi:MAG: threonine ammonia-lyase [Rhodospirillales bacterium]|jgi:threonine dehydratase